jgi:hypothetical protein
MRVAIQPILVHCELPLVSKAVPSVRIFSFDLLLPPPNKLMKSTILLLSSGLLLSATLPVFAQQVPIVGGSGRFEGARFMSPTTGIILDRATNQPTGGTDNRGTFYRNPDVQSAFIRTQLGNIPTNARIETTINPAVNNAFNRPVVVGDRTEIPVRLSFRIPSANGGSVFFNRLPATLNATFTEVPTAVGSPIREYISPNYVFTEVGRVNAPGATAVVRRETDVNVVQYTNGEPRDITVVNRTIPGGDFTQFREGTSYTGDYKFDITGGSAGSIDTSFFINSPGTQPTAAAGSPPTAPLVSDPKVHYVIFRPTATLPTTPPQATTQYQVYGSTVIYVSEQKIDHPVLGNDIKVAYNTGYNDKGDRSNCKCQGQVVLVDGQRNVYIPVGVPSRVFPGLMGMQQIKNPNPEPPQSPKPDAKPPTDSTPPKGSEPTTDAKPPADSTPPKGPEPMTDTRPPTDSTPPKEPGPTTDAKPPQSQNPPSETTGGLAPRQKTGV